jgi:digeranylgeranylglycerophospholipid reductase
MPSVRAEMVEVDVLVVGMGPAGASAAAIAARAGLKVLAIERRRRPGQPVQCAEFVPQPLLGLARALGAVRQPISAMVTSLPSGATHTNEFRGALIDRALFDRGLAARAGGSGAEIWTGTVFGTLDRKKSTALVFRDGVQCKVRYRALIASDGPRSAVARALGLPPLETVRAQQSLVRLRRPDDRTRVWLSDAFAGGYAWLFPKGTVANFGVGTDRRFVRRPAEALRGLYRRLSAEGVVEPMPAQGTGGLIPCSGLREALCVGNVAFAGDAAGTTHPVSGAGIESAVATGELAGEAAVEFLVAARATALEEYAEEVRDRYGAAFKRALERRKELERLWSTGKALDDRAARRGWIAFNDYYRT